MQGIPTHSAALLGATASLGAEAPLNKLQIDRKA